MELIFEWDRNKAKSNLRKHKISFDEAKTVFEDEFLITFPDDFNPIEENRFISIGFPQITALCWLFIWSAVKITMPS
jgi:uncharacterized DUF497 family protein